MPTPVSVGHEIQTTATSARRGAVQLEMAVSRQGKAVGMGRSLLGTAPHASVSRSMLAQKAASL